MKNLRDNLHISERSGSGLSSICTCRGSSLSLFLQTLSSLLLQPGKFVSVVTGWSAYLGQGEVGKRMADREDSVHESE